MPNTQISKDDRAWLVSRVQSYFSQELDQDIGNMDAEFLIDFFAETLGPFFYNNGLQDAQILLARKLDDISDELSAMERLPGPRR